MTSFTREVKKQTDGIASAFAGLGKFKGVVAGLLTGASVVGFARMIQSANDLTDSLRDASIRLGVGVGDLQAFQLAAGNAGIEADQLTALIGKLNKTAGDIKIGIGSEKAIASLGALGISVEQVKKSNPSQLFEEVIDKLGGIEDPAARAALAMQIFGKSGQTALTLVADGAGALKEAKKLINDYGLALTSIDANNVDAANDALGTLGQVATFAKQKLGAELAPVIAKVGNDLLETGKKGGGFGAMIHDGVQVAITGLSRVIEFSLGVGNAFSAGFNVIQGVVSNAGAAVLGFASDLVTAVGTTAPNAFNSLLASAETALTYLKQGFVDLATAIANSFVGAINASIGAIETLINTTAAGINGVIAATNAIAGTSFSGVPTANFGRASNFNRFPVDGVDLGRVDTFGQGTANGLGEWSSAFGQSANQQFLDAGTDVRQSIEGFGNAFSADGGRLADGLKEATDYANQLTGALGGDSPDISEGKGGAAGAMDKLAKKTKKAAEEMKFAGLEVGNVWQDSMQTIGNAIEEFVKTGKLDFKSLVDSLIADLASAALKNAINSLFGNLFSSGNYTTAEGVSGNSILNSVGNWLGTIGSFEGGGYTGSGSRSGGLDGRGGRLAMVHPNETVIDHDKVRRSSTARRGGGRPVINVSTPITLMPGVSHQELADVLPMLKRDIIKTIPELIARGGRYASAFGQ